MRRLIGIALVGVVATVSWATARAPAESIRVWLHAHNCYPDGALGDDRLTRALDAASGTVAIEQDLVWDAVRGVPVVAHETALTGAEPTLEAHFFVAVAPQLERALAEGDRASWPRIVLHLDFKTNEPAHHASVWALLGRYERFLTTAPRTAAAAVEPFSRGPLLVLTEQGEGQERVFHDAVPIGGRLRLFGTVPAAPVPEGLSPEARADLAIEAPAETVIASAATNYRRWTNHAWAVVERGGPPRAADWTATDRGRLECARRPGARPRAVDPVLHAERPSARPPRRRGLERRLQLRQRRRSRGTLARSHRRRGRLHRHRPVRSVQRRASADAVSAPAAVSGGRAARPGAATRRRRR